MINQEREKEIRETIRIVDLHPKYAKFKDPLKQMIIELLDEIDSLRSQLGQEEGHDEADPLYRNAQETKRDQLKLILKTEVHNEALSKFLEKKVDEK